MKTTAKIDKNQAQIELLSRGVEEIIDKDNLERKLKTGKKLRVKLGIDPTSPNIHLGRSIPLLKLRDFQQLGHKVVFIVGDFTGVIGDTSDKDSERPMLTKEIIKKNMKDYAKQAGKILDLKKCEVRYNSEWLGKLNYFNICEQANQFSVAEFIARENIKKRLDAGKRVSLREVLYPLMQGYDSVAVKADVELGGTDQRFNLLAGRKLQEHFKQEPQDVIIGPLMEGTDGRKMSSSWGNVINVVDAPDEMFGKTMSLADEYIIKYFTLATRVPMSLVSEYQRKLLNGENPRNIKVLLAKELVRMYHSEKQADEAEANFDRQFKQKLVPENIPEMKFAYGKCQPIELLSGLGLTTSKSEARRLLEQGGVKIANEKWTVDKVVEVKSGLIIQAGKRKFVKIK